MQRHPAVAGQFYPADPVSLKQTIGSYLPENTIITPNDALCAIVPHAGYIYSGAVAAETLSRVTITETVVILGPNHRGIGAQIALMARGVWEMPSGCIEIDERFSAQLLGQCNLITDDPAAHRYEHSLEVQVPFLQHFGASKIVPLCLSMLNYDECQSVAHALAETISDSKSKVLMVASTDMTHYESRRSASAKDRLALERIQAMDPRGLYETVITKHISMCGFIPTTIALLAAVKLGATKAELIRYTDSGAVSGDTSQVVGYAGFVVS